MLASPKSSCRTLRLAFNASPLKFKAFQDTTRDAEPKRHTSDMLRSDIQFTSKCAEIDLAPLPLAQFPLQRAKMSVQIESPSERTLYKQGFMNVKDKSALVTQNLRVLGARIRAIRMAKGLNQKEFGAFFGVSQAAISNWEKGEDKPTTKILVRLAEMTADSELRNFFVQESGFTELLMNFGRLDQPEKQFDDVREIRLLKDAIAAGTPRATNENEIAQILSFPKSWFPSSGELFALRIVGDSMAPVIGDGYIVIVDVSKRDPKKLVEHMVAAREGDGITIKWLRRDGNTFLLVPQHVTPRHPVRVMRAEGSFSIVGEVIRWIGAPTPARK